MARKGVDLRVSGSAPNRESFGERAEVEAVGHHSESERQGIARLPGAGDPEADDLELEVGTQGADAEVVGEEDPFADQGGLEARQLVAVDRQGPASPDVHIGQEGEPGGLIVDLSLL